MTEALTVGELSFEVRRSSRRRTMEIVIERGGELFVVAPEGVGSDALEGFVREKQFWIYTKIAQRESLRRPSARKELITGEGFPYLGRSHRLLLVDRQDVALKLNAGRFRLVRSEASRGRAHFVRWYVEHARAWLTTRVERWVPRTGATPIAVEVRDLGFRWGSCARGGRVNFHWASILLSPATIDYVIVHELAHLHEPRHTPEFWTRVERAMPDYAQRKRRLAEHGGEHVLL